MSYSLRTKLNVGTILLTMVFAVMLLSGSASAQTEVSDENQTDSQFSYVAEKGDNLTKLVRRSVELYAAELDLNSGQAIAAETCAVQELGAFELSVGQEVNIDESVIESAVTKATELDEAAVARWASYGPITRGDASVQPVKAPEYVAAEDLKPAEEDSSDSTEQAEVQTVAEVTDSEEDNEDAPWYWWAIGGGAIGAMWYVLGGNEVVKNRRKK